MAAASKAALVSPQRRSLIGKVHVAKKELCLTDDDYQGRLIKVTGHASADKCSDEQLVRVLADFRDNLGWQAKPKAGASAARFGGRTKQADHATARKARALWISLYQLGVVNDRSEKALEAFAKKQTGAERMQWADQSLMYKLIEALNDMARRNGWDAKSGSLKQVKVALVQAILVKLKAADYADVDWDLAEAAERICGFTHAAPHLPTFWEFSDLDAIAGAFGHLLRTGQRRD